MTDTTNQAADAQVATSDNLLYLDSLAAHFREAMDSAPEDTPQENLDVLSKELAEVERLIATLPATTLDEIKAKVESLGRSLLKGGTAHDETLIATTLIGIDRLANEGAAA